MSQNAGRIGWVGSRQHAEMRNRLSPSVTSEQIDVALTAENGVVARALQHFDEAAAPRAPAAAPSATAALMIPAAPAGGGGRFAPKFVLLADFVFFS